MFKVVPYLNKNTFLRDLRDEKTPQRLKITNVTDLKEKGNGNKAYFYVDIENLDTKKISSLDYTVGTLAEHGNPEILHIDIGTPFHKLISYASGLTGGAIRCSKEDIDKTLTGLEFMGKCNTSWKKGNGRWEIIPVVIEEETEEEED